MRRSLTCFLAFLPAILFAQSKVHLEFQSSAPRVAWVSDQLAPPPENAQKFDSTSYDLDTSGGTADSFVEVLDTTSGNVAAKKVSAAAKGWLVKDADFNLIGHVKVKIQHEGVPVEVAGVQGNDGARTQNLVIDSTSKGIADFYDVKPGNFKVSISYHSDSKNKTQAQSFQIDLKRDTAAPLLVVEITSPVATIGANSPGAAAPLTPASAPGTNASAQPIYANPKQTPAQKTVGEWALFLLGICFAGLIVYFGFTWLQRNHTKAEEALKKVGVTLSDPTPVDPAGLGVPVTPAAAAPQPQIILQDAAPTPLMPSPAVAVASAAASPQLRSDNGVIYQLPEGSAIVSRDPGSAVSLVGESSVSRRHAEIIKHGNHVTLKDLGSTNGTFVNSIKVDGEVTLHPGDSVQFGTVRLRYEG